MINLGQCFSAGLDNIAQKYIENVWALMEGINKLPLSDSKYSAKLNLQYAVATTI